ncbi:MAG: hypothetical protein DMD78_15495 [Candidatus Rokuibacteriota bacterium]|nr:MAG: hypothetical protein DMD78_15495 [Candidatus Rokubacteria bacterium]
MRSLVAVVVLLLTAPVALAGDPPGGKGWYQVNRALSVPFSGGGNLLIATFTPGRLVEVTAAGRLRIEFERGISTALKREITVDGGFSEDLTITVDPDEVTAFVRQPLSKATPSDDSSSAGGSSSASGGGALAGLGGGQSITSATLTRTTVTIEDVEERRAAAPPAVSEARESVRRGVQIFPPSAAGPASGGSGKSTRVIALEEHEAWLKKVLRLLDEDGARCETKGYGPGWISICDPVPFRG